MVSLDFDLHFQMMTNAPETKGFASNIGVLILQDLFIVHADEVFVS